MIRIGVDFGGTKIEAAALDEGGAFLSRRRAANPRVYGQALRTVRELVDAVEREAGAARIEQVGIGAPGSISPTTGVIRNANSTWLNGRALDRDLTAALDRAVRVANDANCLALSEAVDGAGKGQSVVFGLILGTGVGGGLCVDGKLVEGRNGIAGEIGHAPLPWAGNGEHPGPACWCGRRGCVETWLSGGAFAREYGAGHTAELVGAKLRAGDPRAKLVFERYVERLGRLIALICDIVDPDVFVIGGGMSNIHELYDLLPAAAAPHMFTDTAEITVKPAKHGDSSGVRGAAWLWPAEPE